MKKLAITVAVLSALFATACEVEDPNAKDLSQSSAPQPRDEGADKPAKDDGPELTADQENAIDSANQYLGNSAFSRKGLIDQLKFEGFNQRLAAFAVNYIKPDWRVQAAKSAEAYLSQSSFSRQGLKEQLVFEGFTPAQADYGVAQAYK